MCANVVEVLNYSSWGKNQGPCPPGAEKDWNLSTKKEIKENHIKRIVKKVINEQETFYRDIESGKKVKSSVQLDVMTGMIQDILTIVQNMEDNLSRSWS